MSDEKKWMPDFTDPRVLKNLALAGAIPAVSAAAVARLLGAMEHRRERSRINKMAEKLIEAETPVFSPDPDIHDEVDERRKRLSLLAGMPHRQSEVAKLEPATYLLTGYLAALAAYQAARKASSRKERSRLKKETPALENRVEKAEYDRLFQQADPEGYLEALRQEAERGKKPLLGRLFRRAEILQNVMDRKAEATDLTITAEQLANADYVRRLTPPEEAARRNRLLLSTCLAMREASPDHIDLPGEDMLNWAKRQIKGSDAAKMWQSVKGKADSLSEGLENLGNESRDKGGTVLEVLLAAAPALAVTLYGGGLLTSKYMADKSSDKRAQRKVLDKVLKQELLRHQTPTVSVETDFPWERAKFGGSEAVEKKLPFPEHITERERIDSSGIRL